MVDRFASARPFLIAVAAVGMFGFNAVFVGAALLRPELMFAALANPIAAVFIGEAFLLMGLLAWAIRRAGLRAPGWRAFVVLSMLGSLAFSVPAFVLWHLRKGPE